MTDVSDLAGLTPEQIAEMSKGWTPESRANMLDYMKAAQKRETIRTRYSNVAELAQAIDPMFVRTPAVDLVAEKIETVLRYPNCNLAVSAPPQEFKTLLCGVYTPLRALQINPNTRIILVTYAEKLALRSSRMCREIITRHGSGVVDAVIGTEVEDKLGFKLAATATAVDAWQVANGLGGLIATGLHGTVTGMPADLLIIDDPYKDMAEADSDVGRAAVDEWMSTVGKRRLSPQGSIILIQTRWHTSDLTGSILTKERLLDQRFRTWHHVNIPAISEEGIDDALNRPPGVAMESTRGNTREHYEAVRRDDGDRVFYAMYQGSPRPPGGGLFQLSWFLVHGEVPDRPVATIVAVDPAETGKRDETGIVGGYLCADGTVLLAKDRSGKYTSDRWSREAVELTLEIGAREIAMEAYVAATTYEIMLKRAWDDIHKEAVKKRMKGEDLTVVDQRALSEQMPFRIHKWRSKQPKANSIARSALLRQALEKGWARTVKHEMVLFEEQAVGWQAEQHQPDRIAAGVILHDRLADLGSGRMKVAPLPLGQRQMDAPAWMRRRLGNR